MRLGSSENQPIKIVPKGLRSCGAHAADFFLELLPGPRDREGLPDTLLHNLRKRCLALEGNLTLKDSLAALRRGHGIAVGKKVLIVLEPARNVLAASGRLNLASKTGFGASLEATSTGLRLHFDPEVAIRAVSFQLTVTNSGRLVLRHQPARKVSRRNYRPNRIPALPGLAGKHVQLAINLIAPEGLVAKSFEASVDADRCVFGLLLPIDPSSERT